MLAMVRPLNAEKNGTGRKTQIFSPAGAKKNTASMAASPNMLKRSTL